MKELILVRHGEAEHLLTGVVGGWTDTKLTEWGRQQAQATGERLARVLSKTPVNFYSSDLSRAKETAELISAPIGQAPVTVKELRELNNGLAANLTKEEAKKIANPQTEPILDWIPYPEAESWNMMHRRLSDFMMSIQNDLHDITLIVSHSNSIVSLIHHWLGFKEDMFNVSFDIDPCSITRLRVNRWNEKTISKLNDTAHLVEFGSDAW